MAAGIAWRLVYAAIGVMRLICTAVVAKLGAPSVHSEEEYFVRVRRAHDNFVEVRAARQAGGWTRNMAEGDRESRIGIPDGHRPEEERFQFVSTHFVEGDGRKTYRSSVLGWVLICISTNTGE